MPSVGTSRVSHHLYSGREKENKRKSTGGIEYSPDNLALAAGEMPTERLGASDSYMTSTQMAYMSGEKSSLLCLERGCTFHREVAIKTLTTSSQIRKAVQQ